MSELRRFILVILSVVMSCGISIYAQELKCDVEINSEQIQNSSKEVFTTLKQAIADYMNTNKWTDAQFSANEKIECKMYFTIKSYNDNIMSGDLQIQSNPEVPTGSAKIFFHQSPPN